ncbi:WD40 repeat-like protein [Irpex rosettiformis]|uniref:WD40 repeat-like protein n=1 Tax=Irpex rosettiformis TaxID=378272 RepID=A0ACB8TP89_9APHY|nr:WD40 repeat-like protein [Irpex rosettiformis]
MTSFPHNRLFLGQDVAVVISGYHIQVLNTQTGEVIKTTARFEGREKDNIIKSGPIRCADVDVSFTHLVTSGEDKQLKVWRLEDLTLLNERELPKKPTDVHFTRDGQTILVSDKFGDIFSYPLVPVPISTEITEAVDAVGGESKPRSQIISHENPSGGNLVLGHTSLLTSFLLTEDEKFIVSADRDEHIRVSWYPQGYVIERYCLGHEKFVHTVHIPTFAPSVLISGGGDPKLKLWDWMSGELLCDIQVGDVVTPFITVRPPKGKWGRSEDDDGEGKAANRKRRRGRGKGKAKLEQEELGDAEGAETTAGTSEGAGIPAKDVTMQDADEEDEPAGEIAQTEEEAKPTEDPLVLVIHRVASVDVVGQEQFIVFSVVGATAIFYCPFPSNPRSTENVVVHSVQLNKPAIDFSIDETGHVWVLVDGERETDAGVDQGLVRLLHWTSGQLIEDPSSADENALLKSLNSTCKIPATSEDIKTLDIYSALSAMPKHVDPEHDPFEGTTSRTSLEKSQGKRKAKELSQRGQARLKKKQAVLAKMQEQADDSREGSVSAPPEDVRDTKKVKAVTENL